LTCPSQSDLERVFDVVQPFKQHYVCDLSTEPGSFITKHHRYYASRALRQAEVMVADEPTAYADEWTTLYQVLVGRHGLRGLKAFSREAFGLQLGVRGAVLFRLVSGGQCIGAHIWYVDAPYAHSHLMALSEAGYACDGSYALYSTAIHSFADGRFGPVQFIHLGGGAGVANEEGDGLAAFKRGWANSARTAFLCGSVLHPAEYDRLVHATGTACATYFPAYRAGELL
jgi:hypothetical protein